MASVQQGEKQLFEKFWRGTFKAVATPRPESIIVASITARKPLPRQVRELKQDEEEKGVSCTKRAISGFVFCRQDARRLQEPALLPVGLWTSVRKVAGLARSP
ncbi:hypothetical protein CB1_001852012 [Camelus ferus]|nr:hypothetical protein CB1_001852012 [Camelus ferus]